MIKKAGPIIIGVTGSIAAYRACDIIGLIKKSSLDVEAILTKDGERFITPITLQALSGNRVMTDMFEAPQEWNVAHMALAERVRAILIAPATANIIGKIAGGICDDLLTCVVAATKAPVLIAPAMNANMYRNEIVQGNISKLKKCGYRFVGPIKGPLTCGYDGIGHIADSAEIVKELKRLLK